MAVNAYKSGKRLTVCTGPTISPIIFTVSSTLRCAESEMPSANQSRQRSSRSLKGIDSQW